MTNDPEGRTGYTRIYTEQHPRLLVYARGLSGDPQLAEDLAAEAHFTVWRELAEGRRIDDIAARLRAVVRELAEAVGATPPMPVVGVLVRALRGLPEYQVSTLWLAEAVRQRQPAERLAGARAELRLAFRRECAWDGWAWEEPVADSAGHAETGPADGAGYVETWPTDSAAYPEARPTGGAGGTGAAAPDAAGGGPPLLGPALLTFLSDPARAAAAVVLGPLRFGVRPVHAGHGVRTPRTY